MRFIYRALAGIGCVAALHASGNALSDLAGSYTGTTTVKTSILAEGSATVKVTRLFKHGNSGTIDIDGAVSVSASTVPLRTKLKIRKGRVISRGLLLGLQARPVATRVAKLKGGGDRIRFRLKTAPGATFNGDAISGTMNYSFVLKGGWLFVRGSGSVKTGEGAPQRVVIMISALRNP